MNKTMKKEVAIRDSAEEYLTCRFCRRAAGEWMYWDSDNLEALAGKYLPHVVKESFLNWSKYE